MPTVPFALSQGESILAGLLAAACGVGLYLTYRLLRIGQRCAQQSAERAFYATQFEQAKEAQADLQQQLSAAASQLADSKTALCLAQQQASQLEQQNALLQKSAAALQQESQAAFSQLSTNLLREQSALFKNQAQEQLDTLLSPLATKLQDFSQGMSAQIQAEAKERFALKEEIVRLASLHAQISHETKALTSALRGDNKAAGDWGEFVLEQLLSAAGLREGFEYRSQGAYTGEDGQRLRPDVVILLPEDKHLIIDAKVSLKAFLSYQTAASGAEQAQALREHIASVERHIDMLASKHYSQIKDLRSPDFVFLFIPLEPAFMAALAQAPELCTKALAKKVVLASATALLPTLKTVASLWRLEKQNRNAERIASEGGKLYDKFAGFVQDLEKVGSALEGSKRAYDAAMGKLHIGPGNLLRRIEKLRELGSSTQKALSLPSVEGSDSAPS